MLRIFDLLMMLCPAGFRTEFGAEIRVSGAGKIVGGATFALGPGKGRSLARPLEQLVSRLLVVCVLAGIAAGQPVKQHASTLELARSIYSRSFTALRVRWQ